MSPSYRFERFTVPGALISDEILVAPSGRQVAFNDAYEGIESEELLAELNRLAAVVNRAELVLAFWTLANEDGTPWAEHLLTDRASRELAEQFYPVLYNLAQAVDEVNNS